MAVTAGGGGEGEDEESLAASIYRSICPQLNPHLLSCQELCQILDALRIPVKDRDRSRKHILVFMCDRHVVPKPQRSRFSSSGSSSSVSSISSVGQTSAEATLLSPTKRSHERADLPSPNEPARKIARKDPPLPPVSLKRNVIQLPDTKKPLNQDKQAQASSDSSSTTGSSTPSPSPCRTGSAHTNTVNGLSHSKSQTNSLAGSGTTTGLVKKVTASASTNKATLTSVQTTTLTTSKRHTSTADTCPSKTEAEGSPLAPPAKKPRKLVTWP